ncbi:hypothetical protein ACFV1L_22210 [Kitasatospora sp. NPDC059646]|uniref:hypothetical protein n=1 Tax=Kitasatospora sp. NPDC059646 TaxID=3346893 RepID=UPI0036B172FE
MEIGQSRVRRISTRLDRLITAENERRRSAREHGVGTKLPDLTYDEIAERANAKLGPKAISSDTIRNLHLMRGSGGRPPNPTVNTLDALAAAFGIDDGVLYFTGSDGDAETVHKQLDAVHTLAALTGGSAELLGLMARATALTPGSIALVADLASRLREIEAQHTPSGSDPTL